jgi:hypothetical protein
MHRNQGRTNLEGSGFPTEPSGKRDDAQLQMGPLPEFFADLMPRSKALAIVCVTS